MIPWTHLDTATVPDGGGELRLMKRGEEFSIMAGSNELMNSRISGSEVALANLSWAKISHHAKPHILIGGLGMGFTLRAALADLPKDGKLTVAELVPAVIDWARGPMAEMHGGSLDDPRVTLRKADVGALIRSQADAYDAILLDVDNGPEGLTRRENDRLYNVVGLQAAKRALRPGGVLAVWASGQHPAFAPRLRWCGFEVEEHRVRARGDKGARHIIWIAVNPR